MAMLSVREAAEVTGWPENVLYEAMIMGELDWKRSNGSPCLSHRMLDRWQATEAPYEGRSGFDMLTDRERRAEGIQRRMALRAIKNPQQP